MKKLVFLFAMIFAVSMAMGQNSSSVTQNANSSDATVVQTGDLNQSDITQQIGQYHEAQVDQLGNSNILDLLQDNTNTFTDVDQIGDGNTADIFQRSRLFNSSGADVSSIVLMQNGDNNNADISQDAEAAAGGTQTNVANIIQDGDQNTSDVVQNRPTGSGTNNATVQILGDENMTDFLQDGDGNSAVAKIGYNNDGQTYESNLNEVTISQVGMGNSASFGLTMGDGNIVSVDQDGDNNYTELGVKYGDDNELTEVVTGNGNRTRFGLNAAWGEMSSDNVVSITKNGDGNYVAGSIEGDENDVNIMQDGTNNMVGTSWHTGDGVSIVGSMNDVDISQNGMGNSSLNSIAGNSNVIDVTQSN